LVFYFTVSAKIDSLWFQIPKEWRSSFWQQAYQWTRCWRVLNQRRQGCFPPWWGRVDAFMQCKPNCCWISTCGFAWLQGRSHCPSCVQRRQLISCYTILLLAFLNYFSSLRAVIWFVLSTCCLVFGADQCGWPPGWVLYVCQLCMN
jgi:hypothetical protein